MENYFSLPGLYLLINSTIISSLSDCSYLLKKDAEEKKSLTVLYYRTFILSIKRKIRYIFSILG